MGERDKERESNHASDHHSSVKGDRTESQYVVQKNRAGEEIDQR
jgi:hypothetical protein